MASQGVLAQVHWAQDDPEGRPVLIVHLKAALKQDAAGAKRAAEAILTHMECVLQRRLRDDLGRPRAGGGGAGQPRRSHAAGKAPLLLAASLPGPRCNACLSQTFWIGATWCCTLCALPQIS